MMASSPSFHTSKVVFCCLMIVAVTGSLVEGAASQMTIAIPGMLRTKARKKKFVNARDNEDVERSARSTERAAVSVESDGDAHTFGGAGSTHTLSLLELGEALSRDSRMTINKEPSPRSTKTQRLSSLESLQEQILGFRSSQTPGIGEFLAGVRVLIDSISAALLAEHANDLNMLNDLKGTFSNCTSADTLDNANVVLHLSGHEGAQDALVTCRATQAQFEASRTTCLQAKNITCEGAITTCNDVNSENIVCPAVATGTTVSTHIVQLKAYITVAKTEVARKQSLCDNATTECSNYVCPGDPTGPQKPDCDTQLQSLHDKSCMYGEALDSECGNFQACFGVKETDFNTNLGVTLANAETRKLESEVIAQLECIINSTADGSDNAFDRDKINACRNMTFNTSGLEINITAPNASELFGTCPSVIFHRPCTGEYYTQENLTTAEQATCTQCLTSTSLLQSMVSKSESSTQDKFILEMNTTRGNPHLMRTLKPDEMVTNLAPTVGIDAVAANLKAAAVAALKNTAVVASSSAQCSAHPVCAERGFVGHCCPTKSDVTLSCCSS
jgi:hypothetical protein